MKPKTDFDAFSSLVFYQIRKQKYSAVTRSIRNRLQQIDNQVAEAFRTIGGPQTESHIAGQQEISAPISPVGFSSSAEISSLFRLRTARGCAAPPAYSPHAREFYNCRAALNSWNCLQDDELL